MIGPWVPLAGLAVRSGPIERGSGNDAQTDGHRGEDGQVLTNDDLDECHGHTHEVEVDGEVVEAYHYHATWEFPYAVGCFHGTNTLQGPLNPPE